MALRGETPGHGSWDVLAVESEQLVKDMRALLLETRRRSWLAKNLAEGHRILDFGNQMGPIDWDEEIECFNPIEE